MLWYCPQVHKVVFNLKLFLPLIISSDLKAERKEGIGFCSNSYELTAEASGATWSHREERPLSPGIWCPDKMLRWRHERRQCQGHETLPTHTFQAPSPQEGGEAHNGKNWDVIRWKWGGSEELLKEDFASLRVAPWQFAEFPDKAAVLLLLARNACVSPAICARCSPAGWAAGGGPKRHHMARMLEAFSRGRRVQGHNPFHFPGLGEEPRQERLGLGRKVVQNWGRRTLLRGAAIP